MSSDNKQKALRLAFGVHHAPIDAPRKLVLACLQHDQPLPVALAVSMRANGRKLVYVAACIGRTESYVCLLRQGKRAITEALIGPLCAATGTNLLRQVWDTLAALQHDERREIERLAAMLRAA
jgi:hypothetical protein